MEKSHPCVVCGEIALYRVFTQKETEYFCGQHRETANVLSRIMSQSVSARAENSYDDYNDARINGNRNRPFTK